MDTIPGILKLDQSLEVFRMAPEYRRCGVYLVLGYFILVGASLGVKLAGLGRGWDVPVSMAVMLAPVMLGPALLTFRQLLRVDGDGIWRRRFFRWDLWSWDAFASGQIHPGSSSIAFIYTSKPWWNRYLYLEFLQGADREFVLKLIRLCWNPPVPPKLPDVITIKFAIWRRAHLSSEGLRICKRKRDPGRAYPWDEIQKLDIERLDHTRRDFVALDIGLPDRKLKFWVHKRTASWSGADAETLLRYLQKYVPSNRQKIRALFGAPQSLEEANRRLADLERKNRQMRWLGRVTCIALFAWGLLLLNTIVQLHGQNPLRWDWWAWFKLGIWVFMVSGMAVTILALFSHISNALQERKEEVRNWQPPLAPG